MKNNDGHLIIKNAEQFSNKKKIDVIAQNSDKFINIGLFKCKRQLWFYNCFTR